MSNRKIEIQCFSYLDIKAFTSDLLVSDDTLKTKRVVFYNINLLEEEVIHETTFTIIHSNGFRFISPVSIDEITAYIEMVNNSNTPFEQELLSKF